MRLFWLDEIGRLDFRYKKWDECSWVDCGEFGGYTYLNPAQSELKENTSFYPLRAVGELASLVALRYEKPVDADLLILLDDLAGGLDYDNHYTYAPLLLACGYMLCEENLYKIITTGKPVVCSTPIRGNCWLSP